MNDIRLRVLQILEQGKTDDRASLWCDRLITSIVILNVLAIILESHKPLAMAYAPVFSAIETASIVFFSTEFALRLWSGASKYPASSWQGRREYLFSFYGLIDIAAILPYYLAALVPGLDLRVLRIIRLVRLLKISHYSSALEDLIRAIHAERRSFGAVIYLLAIAVVVSASLMYYAEGALQPEKLASISHAVYWTIITLTTVGYGDIYPITAFGKAISIFTAFMGISTLAIFTGIVATSFVNQLARKKAVFEEEMREALSDGTMSEEEDHLLRRLQADFGLSDEQVDEIAIKVRQRK